MDLWARQGVRWVPSQKNMLIKHTNKSRKKSGRSFPASTCCISRRDNDGSPHKFSKGAQRPRLTSTDVCNRKTCLTPRLTRRSTQSSLYIASKGSFQPKRRGLCVSCIRWAPASLERRQPQGSAASHPSGVARKRRGEKLSLPMGRRARGSVSSTVHCSIKVVSVSSCGMEGLPLVVCSKRNGQEGGSARRWRTAQNRSRWSAGMPMSSSEQHLLTSCKVALDLVHEMGRAQMLPRICVSFSLAKVISSNKASCSTGKSRPGTPWGRGPKAQSAGNRLSHILCRAVSAIEPIPGRGVSQCPLPTMVVRQVWDRIRWALNFPCVWYAVRQALHWVVPDALSDRMDFGMSVIHMSTFPRLRSDTLFGRTCNQSACSLVHSQTSAWWV